MYIYIYIIYIYIYVYTYMYIMYTHMQYECIHIYSTYVTYILYIYKGCAGDSVAHICFQAPLCGETARSKQGICNHPPLVILTVFGHMRFRLRET